MVLRWKKSSLAKLPESEIRNAASPSRTAASTPRNAASTPRTADNRLPVAAQFNMPTPQQHAVQQASYQSPPAPVNSLRAASFQPPQGADDGAFRPLPNRNANPNLQPPAQPEINPSQNFQVPNLNQDLRQNPPVQPRQNEESPENFDDPNAMQPQENGLQLGEVPSLQDPQQPSGEDDDSAPNPFPNSQQDVPSIEESLRSNPNRFQMNCDQIRDRALADDIKTVNLDVTPEFGVGTGSQDSAEQKRKKYSENAPSRSWRDYQGKLIVDGKLVDLVREHVILVTASGKQITYRIEDLSDPDQAYVAEVWQYPLTCSLRGINEKPRNFTATIANWKASGLCHKPLYFEDVQLERYGHEIGPVMQPIVSTAHFFGNIAVLPYKAGIHPPNECQYALGYYRPGNCAPWTVGPIPISLRGGMTQAAAITGLNFALP